MTANGVAAWKDLDGDGIATATLNTSGGTPGADSVTTGTIVDGAIIDADINAAAAIAVSKLAAGTATYVLTSTSGTAVWSAPASGAPSGAAGGSLTGTYPNPTIATIPSGATATTQTAADGSTKVATTAYVDTADALKANLASPTFTGTPSLPTGTTATTQTAADGSTKLATTAYVDTANALKANLASPTFTGHPVGVTEAALNNSTRLASTAYADAAVAVENSRATTAEGLLAPLASPTLTGTPAAPTAAVNTGTTQVATTAFVVAQDKVAGGNYQIGPNTYATIPFQLAGTQITQSNAGDGKWARVMMAQSGTLHDVSFIVTTTGGNYNILVLDDGQANGTHTVRTCLGLKGSTATPAATTFVSYDVNISVSAGDTLVFMMTYDGTSAKMAAPVGGLAAIALPASFFPGSGAATTSTKVGGTCLSANVPGSVNATVTDANLPVAANVPFCAWRIT